MGSNTGRVVGFLGKNGYSFPELVLVLRLGITSTWTYSCALRLPGSEIWIRVCWNIYY